MHVFIKVFTHEKFFGLYFLVSFKQVNSDSQQTLNWLKLSAALKQKGFSQVLLSLPSIIRLTFSLCDG